MVSVLAGKLANMRCLAVQALRRAVQTCRVVCMVARCAAVASVGASCPQTQLGHEALHIPWQTHGNTISTLHSPKPRLGVQWYRSRGPTSQSDGEVPRTSLSMLLHVRPSRIRSAAARQGSRTSCSISATAEACSPCPCWPGVLSRSYDGLPFPGVSRVWQTTLVANQRVAPCCACYEEGLPTWRVATWQEGFLPDSLIIAAICWPALSDRPSPLEQNMVLWRMVRKAHSTLNNHRVLYSTYTRVVRSASSGDEL